MNNTEFNVDDLQELPWETPTNSGQPPSPRPTTAAVALTPNPMRGTLHQEEALLRFLQAGNATLTVRARASGERFTFRCRRPPEQPGRQRPIWVSLLNGPDNERSYAFLGTVWVGSPMWTFRLSNKSHAAETAPSVQAVRWLLKHINTGSLKRAFAQAEFWHEGRCGRCGRKLTVPESIASGFGPECAGRV